MGHFNDTHYCSKCGTFTNDIHQTDEWKYSQNFQSFIPKWICGGCLRKPKEVVFEKNEMG